jgi:hypothetical protein
MSIKFNYDSINQGNDRDLLLREGWEDDEANDLYLGMAMNIWDVWKYDNNYF